MKEKKTWNEKLNSSTKYQVKPAPMNIAGMKKGQIMLVPSALIVDEFIRTIPLGTKMDVKTLRLNIAKKYDAEITCPITMGFQLRTVAEAAYENYLDCGDLDKITPFWRVIDKKTPTLDKLSFGKDFVMKQWMNEGLA